MKTIDQLKIPVTPEQVKDPRTPLAALGVTPALLSRIAGWDLSLSWAVNKGVHFTRAK